MKAKRTHRHIEAKDSKGNTVHFSKSGKGFRSQSGKWVSLKTLNDTYQIVHTDYI